jgi:hypothetical protein
MYLPGRRRFTSKGVIGADMTNIASPAAERKFLRAVSAELQRIDWDRPTEPTEPPELPDLVEGGVPIRSISIKITLRRPGDPPWAPIASLSWDPRHSPRLRRTRLPRSRVRTAPVRLPSMAARAPRQQRRVSRSGVRVGGSLDPPGPGEKRTAAGAAPAAAAGPPKDRPNRGDLGGPSNIPAQPNPQDDECQWFYRHARDPAVWQVDTISLATAKRFPTRGRA